MHHEKQIRLSDHFTYRRLIRFTFPSIMMMIFISLYWIVDGFFVSNFAGKSAFAAVNLIMPFLMLVSSLGFMTGAGGSALIGKLLGEKKPEEANRVFSMIVYLTLAAGIVLMVIGQIVLRPVAQLLGADSTMLELCIRYGRITMASMPALILQFAFQSLFVAAEKPKMGLFNTIAAGVMNMVMDFLLVGVFRLGIEGAAYATFASEMVGGIFPLIYFWRKNSSLLRLGKMYFHGRSLLKILGNGTSEFVSNISMSVISMLYNLQLMKYAGEEGIAAYGVLMYVGLIFLAVFIGYAVGSAPVISYHYGARDTDELKNLLKRSLVVLSVCAVSMLAAGELMAVPLSRLYVGYDDSLMSLTVRGLRFFSFSFLFSAVPIFGSSFFTALNDGLTSALISLLRTLVIQVGTVLLLPLVLGVDGIWLSLVAAEIAAAAVTVLFLIRKKNKYGYWSWGGKRRL